MKTIPLTQDKFAIVDDCDFERLNKHKWFARPNFLKSGKYWYARRNIRNKKEKKQFTILMHRQILGLKKGDSKEVDHINHDTLDNRRCNLRICTRTENQGNQTICRKGTSECKGVSWKKANKRWCAQIGCNRKRKHLGYFNNEIDAALVYDKAAKQMFGEYAYTNF